MLRAVTIPVAGPVDGTWDEFRAALKQCWSESTTIANWAVMELAKADIVRRPDQDRLPKMPKVYLYGLAREQGLDSLMDAQSRTALLTAVEAKYRKARFDAIWLRQAALPCHRYPVPYPLHNQSWSAAIGEGGELLVSVRLAGRRWTLRLRGGSEFRRQRAAVEKLIRGEATAGEATVYEQTVTASAHRPGIEMREPGGRNRSLSRVMFKMCLWLPKQTQRDREGTLYVRTSPDALLVYHVGADGEPKYLRCDHIHRWVREHKRRLERMADDLKYEKRWPAKVRQQMVDSQDARVRKQQNRLKSLCHESSVMLARFADRQRVATVMYDDNDKSYVERFPWDMLKTMLAYKLDERGITFDATNWATAGGVDRERLGD